MKVLLVDDDPVMRLVGEYALATVGDMSVTTAVGGMEALAVVDELQPDVILLDYMMPGMDGDEVFTALQSSPATRHIPVVFLTGLDQGPQRETLLTGGAHGCISKPFNPMKLASDITAMLAMPTDSPVVES